MERKMRNNKNKKIQATNKSKNPLVDLNPTLKDGTPSKVKTESKGGEDAFWAFNSGIMQDGEDANPSDIESEIRRQWTKRSRGLKGLVYKKILPKWWKKNATISAVSQEIEGKRYGEIPGGRRTIRSIMNTMKLENTPSKVLSATGILNEMAFPSDYKITSKTSNKSLGKLAVRKDDLGRRARAELKRRLKLKSDQEKLRAKNKLEKQKKKITKVSKKMGTPVAIVPIQRGGSEALGQLQSILSGSGTIHPDNLETIAGIVGGTDPKKLASTIKSAAREKSEKRTRDKFDRLAKRLEQKAAEVATAEVQAEVSPKLKELSKLKAQQRAEARREASGEAAKEKEFKEIIRKVQIAKQMKQYNNLYDLEMISKMQLDDVRTQLDAGVIEPVVRNEAEIKSYPLRPLKTINIANVELPKVQTEPPASKYVAKVATEKTGILNRLKGILKGRFFKESATFVDKAAGKTGGEKDGGVVSKTSKISKSRQKPVGTTTLKAKDAKIPPLPSANTKPTVSGIVTRSSTTTV